MSKITISQHEIAEALGGIECPRVVKKWFWNQWRRAKLDYIVEPFIQSPEPEAIVEGIRKLASEYIKIHKKLTKVNLGDFQRHSSNSTLYKKLASKIRTEEVENAENTDPTRKYGIKSHVAIPALFSGSLIKIEKSDENGNGKKANTQQIKLMFPDDEEQKNVIEIVEPEAPAYLVGKRAIRYIEKIATIWQKVVDEMKYDLFPVHNGNYIELLRFLKPIFNGRYAEIEKMGTTDPKHEYLTLATFLSWAAALVHFKELGTMILFTEIGVTKYHDDVGLGRIDALILRSINGKPPTKKQKRSLERLSKRQYKSVGDAIVALVQSFGFGLELVIIDWKFAVGDGTNGMKKGLNIIKADTAKDQPLEKHENQMERYISAAYVSYMLSAYTRLQEPERIWRDTHFSISGEIHYFFPDAVPMVHKIELSPQERKDVFRVQVVENYTNAKYNAEMRTIEREMLKLAIKQVEEGKVELVQQPAQLSFEQLPKDPTSGVTGVIYSLRERKFVDPFFVIEYMGTNAKNEPNNLMWLDRLIEENQKGNIHIPGGALFTEKTNFIPCLMHPDKTPSMAITPHKNIFKCFSCGITGHFHPDSIPAEFEGKIGQYTKRFMKKAYGEIQKFSLPDRHKEFMDAAQRNLSGKFFGSPAEAYLRDVRCLNPELSHAHGAGYGDDSLIDYLFDMGFLYEEMIAYGLLRFSSRVNPNSQLIQVLKGRGLSMEDIQREVENKKDGEIVKEWGLPALIINNRVTYPLDIQGFITSFYGRSIDPNCPKDFAHQKTKCIGVPQGAYNLTKAMEAALKKVKNPNHVAEILITEGPIDVDTFNQTSNFHEAAGLVGIDNKLLWEMLSMFDGNLITAFDWDKPKVDAKGRETGLVGQRMTAKFVEYMKSVEFPHRIYDFTEPFALAVEGYKDMNGYWAGQWRQWLDHKISQPVAADVLFYKNRKCLFPEIGKANEKSSS